MTKFGNFYLDSKDIFTFIRKALNRRKSIEDYFEFQEIQGQFLVKYVKFNGIDLHDLVILDLANGFGGETSVFQKNCKSVVGLDLNPPPINLNTEQIIADATLTPFPDMTFNFIVCASLIEHVPDPKKLLNEISRIITPNGHVYLSFPPFYSFFGGHSFAPFHYLGEKNAITLTRIFNNLFNRKIFNKREIVAENYEKAFSNWGLYKMTIKKAKQLINDSDFIIVDQSTKWSVINFSKIPLLNEILTWHNQFILRKR